MEIPLIYILIGAEFLLILLGLSITFAVLLLRKPAEITVDTEQTEQAAEADRNTTDLNTSYIDFLEQAMQRNTAKISQQVNIEEDIEKEQQAEQQDQPADESSETTDEENNSPAPDEKQSALLQAREQFLALEKSAAEKSEHEIHFWDSLYEGMQNLLDSYKSTETLTETAAENSDAAISDGETGEKVFYIETQGKKIDGEVNKLKGIIADQGNALSSLQKAVQGAEDELPEDSPTLATLKEQIALIEQQLSDSKMCMDILELENTRLQDEIDNMDKTATDEASTKDSSSDKEPSVDLDQMKDVVNEQEAKIQQLIDTIESLEIEASQADKLKETMKDFTRTSQEMMSCITILEEENERLLEAAHLSDDGDAAENTADIDTGDINAGDQDALKKQLSELEEELIKKDVAYAQLQDEFSSMETEYLSMYEALHGDNS